MTHAILSDIRVIDMTEGVAGPYASQQLGDMGADVIKIERAAGDWSRTNGTSRIGTVGGAQFVALNLGKRNLGLDVASAGGRQIIERLVERADVIVSNYRPGVMGKLGLGYAQCRALNPQIVYCTVSGFGLEGPYAGLPASDTILQAMSGMMHTVGEPGGPPLRVGFPLIDVTAANHAVQAVLLALYGRLKGRGGAQIDISLMAAAAALMKGGFTDYLATGKLPTRQGNQNVSLAPAGAYKAAGDRYITVAVLRDEHWAKFCSALQLERLVDDPRFAKNAERVINRAALDEIIVPIFATQSAEIWLERLRASDVLCGPINTYADVIADPALAEHLPLVTSHMPGVARIMGTPIRFDGDYFAPSRPPPEKGQHTTEILAEIGYGASEIKDLLASGAAFAS